MNLITTPGGEELVLLPRAEYDALLRLRDAAAHRDAVDEDAAEEAWAVDVHDEAQARLASGEDVALPESVWHAIEGGEAPIKVIRRWRGLTQVDLAKRAELTQGYLSELESGAKTGATGILRKLADILTVPLDILVSAAPETRPRAAGRPARRLRHPSKAASQG